MDKVSEPIPKPWEEGYSADRLPKQTAYRKPQGSGLSEQQKLERNERLANNFKGKQAQLQSPAKRKEIARKGAATRKEKKKFLSAQELMEKKNFDPMAFLADVAQGNALHDDHPFLPKLIEYIDVIREKFEYHDGYGVQELLDRLRVEGIGYLHDTYTPKDLRINVAKDLMQYTRPKLKQTEHINNNSGPQVIEPLTPEDITMFKEWFDNEF